MKNKKILIGIAVACAVIFMISVMSLVGFALIDSSDSATENSSDHSATTTTTSKKADSTSAKSVDFFAPGTYKVGVDIQPGSYYAVLTDIQFATNDDKHSGYINIEVNSSSNNSKFYESFIRDVNKPYRITLNKGDTIVLSDNYSPTWNVSFFTLEDYKKHQSSDKSTSSSNSTSSSSSESSSKESSSSEIASSTSTSSSSATTSSSSTTSKTETSESTDVIETTPEELFEKWDHGELQVGQKYTFVGVPINSELSGLTGMNGYGFYDIIVRAENDPEGDFFLVASTVDDVRRAYAYGRARFQVLVKDVDGMDELYVTSVSQY